MPDAAALGARLQAARQALGLTKAQAGQCLGLSTWMIEAMEAGKRGVSDIELQQLAKLYQRPLAWFLAEGKPVELPGFQRIRDQAKAAGLDRDGIIALEQLATDYQHLEEVLGVEPLPPDQWALELHEGQPAGTLAVVLPERFRRLAYEAYERDIISVSKLAELLREDVFELRAKREQADPSTESSRDTAARA